MPLQCQEQVVAALAEIAEDFYTHDEPMAFVEPA